MVVGFMLGLFRMLVDTPVTMKLKGFEHGYTQGTFLWIVNNINFQYFSIIITLFSALVMVGVSYATPAPQYEQIKSLTFGTATDEDRAQDARQLGLAGSGWPPHSCWWAFSAVTFTSADSGNGPRPRRIAPERFLVVGSVIRFAG